MSKGIVFAKLSYTNNAGNSTVETRVFQADAEADTWRKEVEATLDSGYVHLRTDSVYSVEDVKRVTRSYFFSPETMRFFRSRIVNGQKWIGNDLYFVTTEANADDTGRAATIRVWHAESDTFNTVGEFLQYSTPVAARRALAKIV